MSNPGRERFVVCSLGGDSGPWDLPASDIVEREHAYGGEQGLYALACALARLGHECELRGWIARNVFEGIAAGIGARPAVGLPPRRPEAGEIVVVPEGWQDPLGYARVALSPARAVLCVLAAPGLFGWSFAPGWEPADPRTVAVGEVGGSDVLAAAAAAGFALWTNSPETVRRAEEEGLACQNLGLTRASPLPPNPEAKTVDLVYLADNRWGPMARTVADAVEGATVDEIEHVNPQTVTERIARGRILLWPSRIEGEPGISAEARAMGTVPVALSTNPFASQLDAAHGAVVVERVQDMAPAVRALLDDPRRRDELAERGRRTAREQLDPERFVARVASAVAALPPPDAGVAARGVWGEGLAGVFAAERELGLRLADRETELATAAQQLAAGSLREQELEQEVARRGERMAALEAELAWLYARPAVRAALAASRRTRRLRGRP